MKIHEYQAKQIFGGYGVPVPQGRVASTPPSFYPPFLRMTVPTVTLLS